MNTKLLIGGLIAGAAVGVAIGTLLAPEGTITKEKLVKGARKVGDMLNNSSIGATIKDAFNNEVDEVAGKGKHLINYTSDKMKV